MTTPTAQAAPPRFWGRWPLLWGAFAVAILAIPVAALVARSGLGFVELLPTVNATLNATAASLLFAGFLAIRNRRRSLHWKCMLSATVASTVFLVFYLIRFSLTGVHPYPVADWTRTVYLAILGTHTVLAATVPFLAVATLFLAGKKRFSAHRRLARVTFPVWMYVSVTGVIVYAMLYHLAPARL